MHRIDASSDHAGAHRGMPDDGAVVLETRRLSVTVLPGHGAKISSLQSKNPDAEWLWVNPMVDLNQIDADKSYDDFFYGGIDELFPADFPTRVGARDYPDHGELWRLPWTVEEQAIDAVTLSTELSSFPVRAEKRMRVQNETLEIHTTLENVSDEVIPYLWVGHPALRVDPSYRLVLPHAMASVAEEMNGRVSREVGWFSWPGTEFGLDLNRIPPPSNALESYYLRDVLEGRFTLYRPNGTGLEVQFPVDIFPHLWLFLPLGGWRGHYLAVIEPSSGYPTDLADAVHMGTHKVLGARQRIQAWMRYTVFQTGVENATT